MLEIPTLQGTHVRLEPLSLDHVDGLLAAAAESRDSFGFTFVPRTEEEAAWYIDDALKSHAQGIALPFATVSNGRVVGSTRIHDLEYWARSPLWKAGHGHHELWDVPTVAEIGSTWLAASAQRTPVNTETKLLLLRHCFEQWESERVSLKTDERNAQSRAAIERIGGRFEGVRRAQMPAMDGGPRNTAYFSILREEWPAVKAGLLARLAT